MHPCLNLARRALALAGIGLPLAAGAASGQFVNVADTEPALSPASPHYANPDGYGLHYVSVPTSPKPVLVVFIGGSGSVPADSTDIVDEAAFPHSKYKTGYASLALAYVDGDVIGGECGGTDACYTQQRGESVYGKGVVYPGASAHYDASPWQARVTPTPVGDSIVNRLVLLLDYMTWRSGAADPYWQKFLLDDTSGSQVYVSPHDARGRLNYRRPVVPDWSHIVVAGHSQGGGHAAFLAMTVPGGVRRAALFSAPQDEPAKADPPVAQWVRGPSNTPLQAFYGLRNASGGTTGPNNEAEGLFGDNVWNNWAALGAATGPGGLGGPGADTPTSVGDGSAAPKGGSHNLYLTQPAYAAALYNHDSSAANVYSQPSEQTIWDWMFSAGGTD